MTIRAATFGDIDAVCDLLEWSHGESVYADMFPFDKKATKRFLMWSMNHTGVKGKNSLPTLFWVAETFGIVSGVMLATMAPIYQIGIKLQASEIFWVGRKGVCEPKDMSALFTRFTTWAEEDERVWEIKSSSSDAVMKDGLWREMAPFYERRGFETCGELYVRRIKR